MKICFATILLIFVLAHVTTAQQKKLDSEHDQLQGTVKSVRVESAKLSNKDGKWVEEKRSRERITFYDKQGNLTEENIGTQQRLYSNDRKGNRLEKRHSGLIMKGSPEPADFNGQAQADDG